MAIAHRPRSPHLVISHRHYSTADVIVSASYRTDIPAFYGEWFRRRLAAGFARVRNPYGGADYTVDLTPGGCDGFVFWTKNIGPFLPVLQEVRGLPFVVQYTINGYPRALETAVTDWRRAAEHVRRLAGDYGPRAVVWRYDPILMTSLTDADAHRARFAEVAQMLEGAVDEVAVSFANIYRKSARNLAAAAEREGFGWDDPPAGAKRSLLADLSVTASAYGMALTLCSQPELLDDASPARPARCVDARRLSDVAGRAIGAREKGNRPGCGCQESRDIGAYDTCPHGCVYCYAVNSHPKARERFRSHDPAAEMLG